MSKMENEDSYEKLIDVIRNFEEDTEVFFNYWIDIRLLLDRVLKELKGCQVKELNWSNFKIIYNENELLIDRTANPDGSSVYSIKKID